ncbi:MAG TPA: hypothetical protein VL737_04195 [Candidatus Pristimantibacillus sp.]|nr:hypothetical protein [Candidatus Pristimantibacillus sp.]
MIQLPTDEELERLEEFNKPFCLTMYVPHIEQAAANSDRIELKNLLAKAETSLADDRVNPSMVKKMLRPARELLSSRQLWPLRPEGLALFVHSELFQHYYLPSGTLPYLLSIGKGFNLEPFLEVIQDNRAYLVLALSHNNVELFEGDHFKLKRLQLKNFPSNMEEALKIDEYPKWQETHNVAPASFGKGSEAFHGQYNVRQTDKKMLLQFFKLVDRSLRRILQRKNMPLILAGVGYLQPIYRQANTWPQLVEGGIEGNVEHQSPDILRDHAWLVLKQGGVT